MARRLSRNWEPGNGRLDQVPSMILERSNKEMLEMTSPSVCVTPDGEARRRGRTKKSEPTIAKRHLLGLDSRVLVFWRSAYFLGSAQPHFFCLKPGLPDQPLKVQYDASYAISVVEGLD